jgi:cell division protein FtsQ
MWHDVKLLNLSANLLLGLLALVMLAAGLWWCAQRPMFTLTAIRIEPAGAALWHVDAPTIRSAALPRLKGNFFTTNLQAARAAFEAVPWVRRAAVRREWPNRLIVTIEEHEPLGTWGEDGRLLSVHGDLFTANLAEAEEHGPLAQFEGPNGSEKEVVARFNDLQTWLAPVQLVPESLRLSRRYAWTLRLSNGMTVELGREEDRETLKARVQSLVGVYPQLLARLQNRIESVDMRYPNGLALKAGNLGLGNEFNNTQAERP